MNHWPCVLPQNNPIAKLGILQELPLMTTRTIRSTRTPLFPYYWHSFDKPNRTGRADSALGLPLSVDTEDRERKKKAKLPNAPDPHWAQTPTRYLIVQSSYPRLPPPPLHCCYLPYRIHHE